MYVKLLRLIKPSKLVQKIGKKKGKDPTKFMGMLASGSYSSFYVLLTFQSRDETKGKHNI